MENLKELSQKELSEIDGGNWKRLLGPIGVVYTILDTDWDKVWDDMNRGWDNGHKE